jgi:acyl dehydratase
LGVVHTRNRITQHRPLRTDDTGEIHSWMEGHRETARGQEIDLQTQLRVSGEPVWSETSTLLARRVDGSRPPRTREGGLTQHRPLRTDDTGEIHSWMEGHRETARGQEIDLQTQLRVSGEPVWSEISTLLARRADGSRPPRTREGGLPHLDVPPRQDVSTSTFVVSPGVGRQYARVSGDFNPIHITDLTARFFGFKRAIAHGMWSLARCAAEFGGPTFSRPCTLDVAFKRPISFRARTVLESWMADQRMGFSLRDSEIQRDHLLGSIIRAN